MLTIYEKYIKKLYEINKKIGEFYRLANDLDDDEEKVAKPPRGEEEVAKLVRREERELFVTLMSLGLFRANLFPILLINSPESAHEFLKYRYLGKHQEFDDGITGFTSDLSGYFEEMVAIKGEDHLREFLKSSNVDRKKLRDKRVCEAICCAIEGLDSAADVAKWLAK